MNFIKITGIDENRNIEKWLKIADDEDDIYKYKSEKKCETVNNKKEENLIVESMNNLTISEGDGLSSISEGDGLSSISEGDGLSSISEGDDLSSISESDGLSSISESSISSVETNKESSNLFSKTKRYIDKKKGLFILENENELDKVYKDILLKKKECEISIILNIEGNVAKYVQTLKLGICIIKEDNRLILEKLKINNIFLYTGNNKFLVLEDLNMYKIEYKSKILNVVFCKYIKTNNIVLDLLLEFVGKDAVDIISNNLGNLKKLKKIKSVKARCKKSMNKIDGLHRYFVSKIKLDKYINNIIAINSVAGSGKTTTLINLANNNEEKKILYIAFNKDLVEEMKIKIRKKNIKNMEAHTFDALMRRIYLDVVKDINLQFLKPVDIHKICPFLKDKNWSFKKDLIEGLEDYCNNIDILSMEDYLKSKQDVMCPEQSELLLEVWELVEENKFQTFSTIRKLVLVKHYCKEILNNIYDAIFIDEAQDFDKLMLKILLDDTYITKIFVGDTKQAIYEWRGCINAFELLPSSTLNIDFYSTYRVGSSACNYISTQIKNLYIFSKSENNTIINNYAGLNEPYVYLFRGWKKLLLTAQSTSNIWINNYNKKKQYIEKFCKNTSKSSISREEMKQAEDDLPNFLVKLSLTEVKCLLEKIENNLVEKSKARIEFHTIHSYKGLENDTVRISNDINRQKEQNLYYVALTRGMKNLIID